MVGILINGNYMLRFIFLTIGILLKEKILTVLDRGIYFQQKNHFLPPPLEKSFFPPNEVQPIFIFSPKKSSFYSPLPPGGPYFGKYIPLGLFLCFLECEQLL